MCGVGGRPTGSHGRSVIVRVAGAQDLWFGALALVNDQVDGHFTLQTRDVSVAEVVAQLVNLREEREVGSDRVIGGGGGGVGGGGGGGGGSFQASVATSPRRHRGRVTLTMDLAI